jgi:hypothetical protein
MAKHVVGKLKLPMKFEEALSDLLKVKPPTKIVKAKRVPRTKKRPR